ncbi:MAG TPA: O-antigen ligase family protein [Pseudomonadales bacterium]|nr:O-antigen ligase family protein [Pseudomonadales bacterium]
MKSGPKLAANEIYALAFGLFLGLCIIKFGNPVILDQKIDAPASLSEAWRFAWPTHWANWIFFPLAAIGALLTVPTLGARQPPHLRWLLILPLLWLGWQMLSATRTVDNGLTATTLWQFCGCVACYFIGLFLFRNPRALQLLLIGILAGFTLCLVRAADQHFEFPRTQKLLLEGQNTNWANFPPEAIQEMKHDQTVITTNGVDIVNPAILARFSKNRVMGTLVYPNALAGIILLLFPASLVLAFNSTRTLRPIVRGATIALTLALGLAAFFWSGSKFGWLLAMAAGGLCLFRLNWSVKLKIAALLLIAILGLGAFAVRFHNYFANGATSATARLDYWRAAVQTTYSYPLFGTGPGTFQRPYFKLKSPDAEMARLTHNDYLEQFSDSGICGGILYLLWIVAALVLIGKNLWKTEDPVVFALFLGVLAWFVQGIGEFGLYIPALAWTAFVLLGSLLVQKTNPFDKKSPPVKIQAR